MSNKEMERIFEGFFGDALAKADAVIAEAKKKENKEVKINQELSS